MESPLNIVNRCVGVMQPRLDNFSFKDIKSVAPGVRDIDITQGREQFEAFVHCECALAVIMRDRISGPLEIGVSKDCCWPCLQFLSRYSRKPGDIVVSGTHGKIYRSWMLPPGIPQDIGRQIEECARQEFLSWLIFLNSRRTSDSHADSDSSHTDEEEDLEARAKLKAEFRALDEIS